MRDATEKYGDLETKHKEYQLANEEIIAKKNECIEMLKKELETSNEMIKNASDEAIHKEVEGRKCYVNYTLDTMPIRIFHT